MLFNSFGSMLSQIQRVIGNENISCGSSSIDEQKKDFAACVQTSIVRHRNSFPVGGAASNLYLRQRMNDLCSHYGIELVCPSVEFCTDNDGMIA
ncbi:unnamed protein product [Rotaria sordida]|uniref:Gcp-like domain-containing protein n=1 Tax=Rotaria sordida TaxID=392033 RepID=A0A814A8E8_9BILA|nr:unnamed protein product [Rotaria sordida]